MADVSVVCMCLTEPSGFIALTTYTSVVCSSLDCYSYVAIAAQMQRNTCSVPPPSPHNKSEGAFHNH